MDARDRQYQFGNWYDHFEESVMQVVKESDDDDDLLRFPVHFEVCDLCHGKGRHVNPSIDADHGILMEEFRKDPDFMEDYFKGTFDEECFKCSGRRVVPVLSWDRMSPELQERAVFYQREHCSEMREREWELRYGY